MMNLEDVKKTPLRAMREQTKKTLCIMLNDHKQLPSYKGYPRDWSGLKDIVGCTFVPSQQPTEYIISSWLNSPGGSSITIGHLIQVLDDIERFDVIEDISLLLENDAEKYIKNLLANQNLGEFITEKSNDECLTVDDEESIARCGKAQTYDAFLLYHETDELFAFKALNILENQYNHKLCIEERDIIGGLTNHKAAMVELIVNRCRRLIVILSPAFLKSPAYTYMNIAEVNGTQMNTRKVIPCIYSNFDIPLMVRYYFILNFTRETLHWDLWSRLSKAITVPDQSPVRNKIKAIVDSSHQQETEDNKEKSVNISHQQETEDNKEKSVNISHQQETEDNKEKSVNISHQKVIEVNNGKLVENDKVELEVESFVKNNDDNENIITESKEQDKSRKSGNLSSKLSAIRSSLSKTFIRKKKKVNNEEILA